MCHKLHAVYRYQPALRTDQLRDYDRLHAIRHATGAKVFTDLRDDDHDDGNLDGQGRRVKVHFNPEPEQSDDESSSLDDIIGGHVQDQERTFIGDGGAESEAAELNGEDEEADEEDDEEDSGDDSGEEEDEDDHH